MISENYSTIKSWADNGQLVAGQQYLMTDFQTLHIIPNTTDRNDTNVEIPIEPLIVTAISESELDGRAISTIYPQDEIWYDIDNSIWSELEADGAKGRITRRIDTLKRIDVSDDFRNCIFRRWNCDLSAYGGADGIEFANYVLYNTSINAGQSPTIDGYINFVALDNDDYIDVRMFNLSGDYLIENVYIKSAFWQPIANTVFERHVIDVEFTICGANHISRACEQQNVSEFNNNLVIVSIGELLGVGISLPWFPDPFKNWGSNSTQKMKYLINSFLLVVTDVGRGQITGFCDRLSMYHDGQFRTFNKPLIIGDLYQPSHSCLIFTPGGGGAYNHKFYLQYTRHYGHTKGMIFLFSGQTNYIDRIPTFTWSMYDFKTKYGAIELKYKEGVYSSLVTTLAATASLSPVLLDYYAGTFNLTGTGTIVITKINTITEQEVTYRVPLTLKPVAGLTIQINDSNDVVGGFLTNGQTFEANGDNEEYITLEWLIDAKKYRATSGRII